MFVILSCEFRRKFSKFFFKSTSGSAQLCTQIKFYRKYSIRFLYHNKSPVENVKGLAVNSPIANQNNNHLLKQSTAIDEYYHRATHMTNKMAFKIYWKPI